MNGVNYSKLKSWDFSLSRIIDIVLLVAIGFTAAFLLAAYRLRSMPAAILLALLFGLFLFLTAYSVNIRGRNKRLEALYGRAYMLWLQDIIINGDQRKYANFIVDILYGQGYSFERQNRKSYTAMKDKMEYQVIPCRRHPSHSMTAQEIMMVCDEAAHPEPGRKNIIIAASCGYDEQALEFAKHYSSLNIECVSMQDICEYSRDCGFTATEREISPYFARAKAEAPEKKKGAGFARRFPQIRYLLCSLMLLTAAYFMPFKTWYLIMSGISLGLFFMVTFFPRRRKEKQ